MQNDSTFLLCAWSCLAQDPDHLCRHPELCSSVTTSLITEALGLSIMRVTCKGTLPLLVTQGKIKGLTSSY